jgi:DNA-binding NarL/FixJ family response regulator
VIDSRVLYRECLSYALGAAMSSQVVGLASVKDWLERGHVYNVSLIVFVHLEADGVGALNDNISTIARFGKDTPLVVMSDIGEAESIVMALRCGARGYVSSNHSLDVVVEALRMVRAGGVFIPANSEVEPNASPEEPASFSRIAGAPLTNRQMAVIEALRQGKANKTIAFELNMCESTVKVHVRNIMKKLNAHSRTEIAYLVSREGR